MGKKLFLISVTGKVDSFDRYFQESMLALLNKVGEFSKEYIIEPHNVTSNLEMYESLKQAIVDSYYEGYIVIVDALEKSDGKSDAHFNPNVMFEFGGIYYLNKPFCVMKANDEIELPFDIRNLKTEVIPEQIISLIRNSFKSKKNIDWEQQFNYGECIPEKVENFLEQLYKNYKTDYDEKIQCQNKDSYVTHEIILREVNSIKELLNNTAEYIGGEPEAFMRLADAVANAKESLRTTRFANESIVSLNASKEQNKFMEALVTASQNEIIKNEFYRIICNNHPSKWQDIYEILYHGANGIKVYVRKEDYSIHFELVIIDKEVAFIHFYQTLCDKKNGESDGDSTVVQKINSTLKIKGHSVCEKLANIFDRLHHRNQDPSHTLLGIPVPNSKWKASYKSNGCFVIGDDVPEYCKSNWRKSEQRRRAIIQSFKTAFEKWEFEYSEPRDSDKSCNMDKVYMVSGIALVEQNDKFIHAMKQRKLLTEKEFEEGIKWYDKLKN